MLKIKSYKHQIDAFEKGKGLSAYGLLMDMGTGKTKVAIDIASYQADNGIDFLLVVVPNGLQSNWIQRELPKYMSISYMAMELPTNKKESEAFNKMLVSDVFKILLINIEKLSIATYVKDLQGLLRLHRSAMYIDESHRIKSVKASCTKNAALLARSAQRRLIMTGTPVTQGPLDFWGQFQFLSPQILPYKNYHAFIHDYANIVKIASSNNKYGYFTKVTGYKNLDKLKRLIEPYTFNIRKENCLDLPEKVFENYPVQLTEDQSRMYKELVKEAMTIVGDVVGDTPEEKIINALMSDDRISVKNGLTKLLRCQQILGGYVTDDNGIVHSVKNNRISTLTDIVEGIPLDKKVIIWARYVPELKAIKQTLGDAAVLYYGDTSKEDRATAVDRFQTDPTVRFFISQPASGGVGLTLTAATYVIWYSMDFSLGNYLQANDRAHRIGQKEAVTYIHLIAQKTIDEKILLKLAEKNSLLKEFV